MEKHAVSLGRFVPSELHNCFVTWGTEYGVLHVHLLTEGRFAVELVTSDERSRYLTQAEVDSFYFGVREPDGIKELRVRLE